MYFNSVESIVFYVEMRYLFLVFYKRFTLKKISIIYLIIQSMLRGVSP